MNTPKTQFIDFNKRDGLKLSAVDKELRDVAENIVSLISKTGDIFQHTNFARLSETMVLVKSEFMGQADAELFYKGRSIAELPRYILNNDADVIMGELISSLCNIAKKTVQPFVESAVAEILSIGSLSTSSISAFSEQIEGTPISTITILNDGVIFAVVPTVNKPVDDKIIFIKNAIENAAVENLLKVNIDAILG